MDSLTALYKKSLRWTLVNRGKIVLASVAVFVLSLVLLQNLRKELIPQQDQSLFLLSIKTPVGSSITATDQVFRQAEEYLKKQGDVQDMFTNVGNFQNNNVVNAGTIYVILKDPKARKTTQIEVMARVRDDLRKVLPQAEVFTQDLSLTGFSASRGFPVEFTIEGPDWDKLSTLSAEILKRLSATGLVDDINRDYSDGMPEVQVIPNRVKASRLGVSVNAMEQEVSTMIGGQIFSANTQYPKDGHRYYIRVRSEADQHDNPDDISKIRIRNDFASQLLPLNEVAEIKTATGPQLISRVNRSRAVPVYANLKNNASQEDALKAVEKIGKDVLPLGYRLQVTGSAAAFHDAFDNLIFALILGIAVAYMVLASQFNSFIHPVTILMALPFSLSGALIALYVTGQSLSLFSMIGLILLMGIVKKNSILLVDFTNQRRAEGLSPHAALLEACPVRLRPILMTSVACIVGAIPAALSLGPGSETRTPMAICIIGGVLVSTLLTLYVVPCVYSYFVKLERPETEEIISHDPA